VIAAFLRSIRVISLGAAALARTLFDRQARRAPSGA
jgi:hypothetical protein